MDTALAAIYLIAGLAVACVWPLACVRSTRLAPLKGVVFTRYFLRRRHDWGKITPDVRVGKYIVNARCGPFFSA